MINIMLEGGQDNSFLLSEIKTAPANSNRIIRKDRVKFTQNIENSRITRNLFNSFHEFSVSLEFSDWVKNNSDVLSFIIDVESEVKNIEMKLGIFKKFLSTHKDKLNGELYHEL